MSNRISAVPYVRYPRNGPSRPIRL
jgi:hypothetical protein